jgi:hypothetical protein
MVQIKGDATKACTADVSGSQTALLLEYAVKQLGETQATV